MSSVLDLVVKSRTGRNIGNNVLWLNTETNQLMLRTKNGWIPLNNETTLVNQLKETVDSLEEKVDDISGNAKSVAAIVTELPTENIEENKIYLVKNEDGTGDNLYAEYLYVNGAWESIGSTDQIVMSVEDDTLILDK